MKRLFIYYSNSGNGDLVANYLDKFGYEVRKVIRKKPLPKSFFWCMMVGGFLAATNHKDKLEDFDSNIEEYDEIVIGSPIWNGKISCPINTVLSLLKLENKKVTVVFYAGGGEAPKAIQKINKMLPNAKAIILKEPKKYNEELAKLEELK